MRAGCKLVRSFTCIVPARVVEALLWLSLRRRWQHRSIHMASVETLETIVYLACLPCRQYVPPCLRLCHRIKPRINQQMHALRKRAIAIALLANCILVASCVGYIIASSSALVELCHAPFIGAQKASPARHFSMTVYVASRMIMSCTACLSSICSGIHMPKAPNG